MVVEDDSDIISVLVPDGHPLNGQQFTLWPQNGATTYNNGTVRIESIGLKAVRQGLSDLKRVLSEKRSEASEK